MWLGYDSIGLSACLAELIFLALLLGLPYGWSGRLGLVLDHGGIIDISRFRRLQHRWDGAFLAWDRVGGHHALVLCVPGLSNPVALMAGWCSDRRRAEELLHQFSDSGWPVVMSPERAGAWWTGSIPRHTKAVPEL